MIMKLFGMTGIIKNINFVINDNICWNKRFHEPIYLGM